MPSAGLHSQQGKIKLRDNDDDKNNICALKDQPNQRNFPATTALAKVPKEQSPPSPVKVKRESRVLLYASLVGVVLLVLCITAALIGLWHMNRAPGDKDYDASLFLRHLTSDYSVEEIRQITRNVILEEIPRILNEREG